MEKITKDYGSLTMLEGRIFDIDGEMSDNGYIFKDHEAFETGNGICYVSEYGLEEIQEELTELEAIYENTKPGDEGYLSDEEYRQAREAVILSVGETRQTIIDQVRETFGDDYLMTDEQVAYFAEDVFGLADWAYICTYLQENFDIDDCIEYDHDKGGGMFTQFQYEAVMNGQTPKEYADRQLSYGELAELDEEFDTAFIVDEDCLDDWSDKGLGANARITYIEERRTGVIDGPEQFNCPPQFVRK